jgi:hypothetical protein
MSNIKYQPISQDESWGSMGTLGIKIEVGGTVAESIDFKAEYSRKIRDAVYDAVRGVSQEIQAVWYARNPEQQKKAQNNRANLLACFPDKIFVEEIPNGYCHDACCRHLPWFIVTTEVGHFKIGWRKSVINIDWEATVGTELAASLFLDENVTKSGKTIHAWSLEKAKEYIEKIIASQYL